MIRDPVYREAVKHRQAAVEDSRLIRLAPGALEWASADVTTGCLLPAGLG